MIEFSTKELVEVLTFVRMRAPGWCISGLQGALREGGRGTLNEHEYSSGLLFLVDFWNRSEQAAPWASFSVQDPRSAICWRKLQ